MLKLMDHHNIMRTYDIFAVEQELSLLLQYVRRRWRTIITSSTMVGYLGTLWLSSNESYADSTPHTRSLLPTAASNYNAVSYSSTDQNRRLGHGALKPAVAALAIPVPVSGSK